jgi:hypothetical protein
VVQDTVKAYGRRVNSPQSRIAVLDSDESRAGKSGVMNQVKVRAVEARGKWNDDSPQSGTAVLEKTAC